VTRTDGPRFHLSPPVGWMNDPNGLVFVGGKLHAFFQHNPEAPRWGRMQWGHAVSRDLLTWEYLPTALKPGARGPDRSGCWSGCMVFDAAGKPVIFYTGVAMTRGIRRPSILRATSDDGLTTWRKDPGPPVIADPPPDVLPDAMRDPFVWRDAQGWAMLLGAGTTRGNGAVLLYRSDDLEKWRYVGPFLTTESVVTTDRSVDVEEIDSRCWECPQLVRLDGADVLIVSVVDRAPRVRPAHVMAFTGTVSGDQFVVGHSERLGLGPDFYAPAAVRAPDGRQLLLGWVPEDPPPPGSERTWAGSLTFPRVISLGQGGRVHITLAAEVERLRDSAIRLPEELVQAGKPWRVDIEGGYFEMRLTLRSLDATAIRIDINGPAGTAAEIYFTPATRRLTVARTTRVAAAGREMRGSTILPPSDHDEVRLRLLLDGSVLEVTADQVVTATARLPEVGGSGRSVVCASIGGDSRVGGVELAELVGPAGVAD
jgi:beta-fructofuranosidase